MRLEHNMSFVIFSLSFGANFIATCVYPSLATCPLLELYCDIAPLAYKIWKAESSRLCQHRTRAV
ncbi:hypothetical protein BYT27DRAFT_6874945 [Phlegmacium glaucopus]|nr:hypothetical protein BYT27DRAFT_6874945 [Phlegmacium glaucopus]